MKKGFLDFLEAHSPDILCLQETKLQAHQVPELDIVYPWRYWHHAQRPGYSSTAVFCKHEPESVAQDFPADFEHNEGRVQTVRFKDFTVVNVYTPNSKPELERLQYRQQVWDPGFLRYVQGLSQEHPVLVCGDLNVAHQPIDLARPEDNRRSAGFTDEERAGFDHLVQAGFIDTFRHFYPDTTQAYSWWSYRGGARRRNVGWRIDYVLASQALEPALRDAFILPEVQGSDHAPVGLLFEI